MSEAGYFIKSKGCINLNISGGRKSEIARVAVCAASGEDMMASDSLACDREVIQRKEKPGSGGARLTLKTAPFYKTDLGFHEHSAAPSEGSTL